MLTSYIASILSLPWFAQARGSYDYVVVGGGTAGLVLASRLSSEPSVSVLVLEAGDDHTNDTKVRCPGIFASMYGDHAYDWDYVNEPQPGLNNRSHANIAGKGLGGGSAVNFMWWTHPSRRDIDNWGALGNANWSWDALQPYLKLSEAYHAPSSRDAVDDLQTGYVEQDDHGLAGPIVNSFPASYGPFMKAWPRTFEGLGLAPAADPRGGIALGGYVNLFNIDSVASERAYPATQYYLPASGRSNLDVVTGALATKVLFDEDHTAQPRATGISYLRGNNTFTVRATKDVILSAGSMQSSKLLELSGIGDCGLLASLGIKCLVNNTNVGENFQNHLMLPLGWEALADLTTTDDFSSPEVFDSAVAEWEAHKTGPFSTVNGSSALLSLRQIGGSPSTLNLSTPLPYAGLSDAQNGLLLANLASNSTSVVQEIWISGGISPWYYQNSSRVFASPGDGGKYFTLLGLLSHPFSRGSVHIQTTDPTVQPRLDPRYFSHPLDRQLTRQIAFHMQELATRPPLSGLLRKGGMVFQPGYLPQGEKRLTEENVDAFVAEMNLIAFHHSGTNAMLPRGEGGVVDHRLRVYGVDGLRVVDMSVVPMMSQGTPTSLVIAVAERAADFMREEYGEGERRMNDV